MANITIKQIPQPLIDRIKERARINGRSMNREIIDCLEQVVTPRVLTAEEVIEDAKSFWRELGDREFPPYDPAWKREGLL